MSADHNQPVSRRSFLEKVLIAGGTFTGIAVFGSVFRFVYPPPKRMGAGGIDNVEAGPVDDFPPWTARAVVYGGNNVMVVRTDSGFVAVDMKCTHLGCMVEWKPDRRVLYCPCHAGVFDYEGKVLSGPPPRPLPLYRVEVKSGVAYVVGRA